MEKVGVITVERNVSVCVILFFSFNLMDGHDTSNVMGNWKVKLYVLVLGRDNVTPGPLQAYEPSPTGLDLDPNQI